MNCPEQLKLTVVNFFSFFQLSAPGQVEDSWAAGTGANFADRDEEEW